MARQGPDDHADRPNGISQAPLPLEYKWTLWVRPPARGKKWPEAVDVCTVDNVQDFWKMYNNVPDADKTNGEYSFFRDGIVPEWEDVRNAPGGCWKIKLSGDAAEAWLSCLLAAIGGQFPFPDEVFGFVVQPKPKSKIAVWTAHDLSPEFEQRVMATGQHFLKLVNAPRQKAQFQSHAAAKRGEKVPERDLS